LSRVRSHAAKMTAQGKHGNSGNLLKVRKRASRARESDESA
jgi:hypothetical protein